MKLIIIVCLAVLCETLCNHAHAVTGDGGTAANARCKALATDDFSNLEDAPLQVVEAVVVAENGGAEGYCKVTGYVLPQVGFMLELPIRNWNGKFIEFGCGGTCGSFAWSFMCPLRRGYACIASDMGHKGKDQDMLWAYDNLQAQLDFDTRGPHVAALAGRAITERYYGTASLHSYFMGCSNGGIQALAEAQKFPWDFDGIISLSGTSNYSDLNMEILWGARALRDGRGQLLLNHQDLQLVHKAAIAHCDLDDGVRDGIISDPYNCKFDPSELLCKPGMKVGCLTDAQVDTVKKVYSGPMTSRGEKMSYMRGAAPGSELEWIDAPAEYINSSGAWGYGGGEEWSLEIFRYIAFTPAPGARWTLSGFDFDRDYKRLGVSETLWGASNPDLRKFKEAGGKLLVAQGWADSIVVPAGSIDYYVTSEKTMGGREQTQSFFRLFVVPGMGHCTGGEGPFAIDYLTSLERWVEHGEAPDKLIGAHVDSRYLSQYGGSKVFGGDAFPLDATVPVTFRRPVYPYPTLAKYKGNGDPNDAKNFLPFDR